MGRRTIGPSPWNTFSLDFWSTEPLMFFFTLSIFYCSIQLDRTQVSQLRNVFNQGLELISKQKKDKKTHKQIKKKQNKTSKTKTKRNNYTH